MTRGRVWATYVADDLTEWALEVDADSAADPARGWSAPALSGTPPFPRGWLPRKVRGIEPAGHTHEAVVGTDTADLWNGVVTSFDVETTDGTVVTCTVFSHLPERTGRRP